MSIYMNSITLNAIIDKLIKDYNVYSEIVALNYAQRKENSIDEGVLQWNRGIKNKIEEYLEEHRDVSEYPFLQKGFQKLHLLQDVQDFFPVQGNQIRFPGG